MPKLKKEDFKVKKTDKKDFKNSVIQRINLTNEFTLNDLESSRKDLEKMQTEVASQQSLCRATCNNIERNHPFIKDLTEEQRHHVHMFEENLRVVKETTTKLKEITQTMDAYKEVEDVVYEVGGFVKTEVTEPDKNEKSSKA